MTYYNLLNQNVTVILKPFNCWATHQLLNYGRVKWEIPTCEKTQNGQQRFSFAGKLTYAYFAVISNKTLLQHFYKTAQDEP